MPKYPIIGFVLTFILGAFLTQPASAYTGRDKVCFLPKHAVFPTGTKCYRRIDVNGDDLIRCPSSCNSTGSDCSFYFTGYVPYSADYDNPNPQVIKKDYSPLVWRSPNEPWSGYIFWDIVAWPIMTQAHNPDNLLTDYAGVTPERGTFSIQTMTDSANTNNVDYIYPNDMQLVPHNIGVCGAGIDCRGMPLHVRVSRYYSVGNSTAFGDFVSLCLEIQ